MAQLTSTAAEINGVLQTGKLSKTGAGPGAVETNPVPFADLPAGATFKFTNGSAVITLEGVPTGFDTAAWVAANKHMYGYLTVYFLQAGAWAQTGIVANNVLGFPSYSPWSGPTVNISPFKLPGSIATGRNARATGEGTLASGAVSVANGSGNRATGDYSDAGGNYTKATGWSSFSRGGGTDAEGNDSAALG